MNSTVFRIINVYSVVFVILFGCAREIGWCGAERGFTHEKPRSFLLHFLVPVDVFCDRGSK